MASVRNERGCLSLERDWPWISGQGLEIAAWVSNTHGTVRRKEDSTVRVFRDVESAEDHDRLISQVSAVRFIPSMLWMWKPVRIRWSACLQAR